MGTLKKCVHKKNMEGQMSEYKNEKQASKKKRNADEKMMIFCISMAIFRLMKY